MPMRVAILGLGTVGRAVAERLVDTGWRNGVKERGLVAPDLAVVAVREPSRARGVGLPRTVEITDLLDDVVVRPDVDIVVELIGGVEPAGRLILAALRQGHSVVTANKTLLAARGRDLEEAARAGGASLRFEAAVGGGVPVLTPLVRDLSADRIRAVGGILNGTTNFILTAMVRDGADYKDALADAQRLGYAEADPTADVEGFDAAAKLVVLVRLAFGAWLDPADVRRTGITGVTSTDLARVAQDGDVIKLVARAERSTDGSVVASVQPTVVPTGSALGTTGGVTNIIEIAADPLGTIWFAGPGAGGATTASAVLADLLAIGRGEGSTWGSLPPPGSSRAAPRQTP